MNRSLRRSVFALGLAVMAATSGCSAPGPGASAAPVSTGVPGDVRWHSPLGLDHALVGRVFDVSSSVEISFDDLTGRLGEARLVLLGEQHPNQDHHVLQARILAGLVAAGRRPAVVFEQFDVEDQASMDEALAQAERDGASLADRATALAEAVDWAGSGWPPFDDYRPVVEEALGARLPVRAGNLSREKMRALFASAAQGNASSGETVAPLLDDATRPLLSPAAVASLTQEIRESHCGYASDAMVAAMVEAQRRRDHTMATVALEVLEGRADPSDGAVLVAGFGHTRVDYGVPVVLRYEEPGCELVSVAFVEVLPEWTTLSAYAEAFHAARLPFDFVVFTPRSDEEDPCEKFRASLEKMKARHGAAPAPPAGSD